MPSVTKPSITCFDGQITALYCPIQIKTPALLQLFHAIGNQ